MVEGERRLAEILELVAENNKILRQLRRRERWRSLVDFVKWAVILGLAGWIYYQLQPVLQELLGVYANLSPGLENLKNLLPSP